jgi:microcystin-dependent protein
MSIAQNSALFSLLGTQYGGNGTTTFALPNLQGRVPIHQGQGAGLSVYEIGQMGGTEQVALAASEIPTYAQTPAIHASIETANTTPADIKLPHSNMQPYITVNYCIAIYGIYPSRA